MKRFILFLVICFTLSCSVFAIDFDLVDQDPVLDDFEFEDFSDSEPSEILVIDKLEVEEFLNDELSEFLLETFADLKAVSSDSNSIGFEADTVLGHLQFVLPAGSVSDPFLELDNGSFINITSGTLYLYCPAYPAYTFQASRFSGFQYRTAVNSTWHDLNISNITGLSAVAPGTSVMEILPTVFLAIIALYCFSAFTRSFGRF